MKKISNKGFVLAETIVVAVFMVTIFTVLYSNYYPIMANYEKKEYYDDIDSKYIAFWLKYMIQDRDYNLVKPNAGNYTSFSCNQIGNSTKKKSCIRLTKEAGLVDNPYCNVNHVNNGASCFSIPNYSSTLCHVAFITNYELASFKTAQLTYKASPPDNHLYHHLSDGFIDYINFLPDYNNYESLNGAKYRLIIELYDNREPNRAPMYKYATIEVNK